MVGAERFLAEIETTANLQHPHILPLYDSGEADSFLFYVMPFVEGETLRQRLDREKQLPVDEAVRIATAEPVSQAVFPGATFQRGEQRILFAIGSSYRVGSNHAQFDIGPDDRGFSWCAGRAQVSTRRQ